MDRVHSDVKKNTTSVARGNVSTCLWGISCINVRVKFRNTGCTFSICAVLCSHLKRFSVTQLKQREACSSFPLPVLLQGSRAGVDRLRSRGHKDQDGQRSSLPPVHDHLHWSLLLQLQRRGHMQSCRPALEQVNMTVGRDAQEDRNAGPGCVFNKRNQCVLCKYHFDNISLIQKCLCSLIQALSFFSLIGLFLSNCGLNLSYKHVLTTQP